MVFDSLKRMLGRRSRASAPDFDDRKRKQARDLTSILQSKIEQLNEFRNACDAAGLKGDLDQAVLSAKMALLRHALP